MTPIDVPLARLRFFQGQLGLTQAEISSLDSYAETFLSHREEFAEYLHRLLLAIPEARRIVELMETRGGLRRNWRCWYEGFFAHAFDDPFYQFLWGSGLKHLSRNVDQRFIHLGYCMARLFVGEIVDRDIPGEEGRRVRGILDKMLDLCLLVATDALLAGTTQCDREVINGISHQVRNPLTVIGGFVHNLQRKIPADSPMQSALESMAQETRRLEAMVRDVGTFLEIMQRDPRFAPCSLDRVLEAALRRLREDGWTTEVENAETAPLRHLVDSDGWLLEEMFYQLLQNAFEATKEAPAPRIRVTGRFEGVPRTGLTVEIFNNGRVVRPEEVEHLFTPFSSSKPTGSGFGLPLAALVTRKVNGQIDLVPVGDEGTLATVTLPARPIPADP